jgi:sulfatase modifying factor 1
VTSGARSSAPIPREASSSRAVPTARFVRAALVMSAVLGAGFSGACDRRERDSAPDPASSGAPALGPASPSGPAPTPPSLEGAATPALLYLPDGGDDIPLAPGVEARPTVPHFLPGQPSAGRCPPDMVDVRGRFCIDRYEATLVDAQGRQLSPYFPPAWSDAQSLFKRFRSFRTSRLGAPEVPLLPDWQKDVTTVLAQARPGVVPNGYLSGVVARAACAAAGKRLCTAAEWETACRGEQGFKFPYGPRYEAGRCNVFREAHPAYELHGNASEHHLDPRLNLVAGSEGPLLRKTGATPDCKSTWGDDAVYDMVGNLDEWIDDPGGTFAGGFYSRATREGCAARISSHPIEYFDYSLGVRCCR